MSHYAHLTIDERESIWELSHEGKGPRAIGRSIDPLFVDPGAGDFRLQASSPCINAGLNASDAGAIDLAGRPRVAGATVDIGAYEFQSPASRISYAWLQEYGLSIDGSADGADPDGDGASTWQEWGCGTNPTNGASVLRLLPVARDAAGVTLSWPSTTNLVYWLERSTNLGARPAFQPLAAGIPGQPGSTSYTDTNAPGPVFYRVSVRICSFPHPLFVFL